ncbi:MAG: O-antigen ligase family protein [Thiomicrospira sp.]|uniref:O-antigen ligase family protein n=1 Tax=Thiomicrospira sp. TaxID=935 RepID=UPI001A082D26|nr:O-antigen ligase family protein [Thiomicrospira sp.]MBE0494586.1 O-antigen ligase family protein [Thiomicrospira sp.]
MQTLSRGADLKILFFLLGTFFFGYNLARGFDLNFEILYLPILIFGIYVWRKYQNEIALPKTLKVWFYILFFYWTFTVISSFTHWPLGSTAWANLNIAHNVFIFMLLGIAIYVLKPSVDFFWAFMGLAGVAVISLFVMEVHAVGGLDALERGIRLGSVYLHPVKMGVFANGVFIILMGSLPWAFRKGWSFFSIWIILVSLVFLAIVFSQTRQAWIGWPEALIAWSVYYVYYFRDTLNIRPYKVVIAIFALILLIAATLTVTPAKKLFVDRVNLAFNNVSEYLDRQTFRSSVGERLISYEGGVRGIVDYPWFGVGSDQFREKQSYYTAQVAKEEFSIDFSGLDYRHMHNQYLMSWFTYGVFVFVMVLFMLGFLLVVFTKGIANATTENKAFWVAGFVFTVASILVFVPDSPLVRSDTSAHFLLFSTLLLSFALQHKHQNEPYKSN